MKKKSAKIISCLLCLAMLLSMAAPALAALAEPEPYWEDLLDGEEIYFAPGSGRSDGEVSLDAPATDGDSSADSAALAVPLAAAGEVEYEIYPTPQSITYSGSNTVTLPQTMQVTYGAGIDSYTKDRAVEAFAQAGVTLSESATTGIKLQVSIKGDSETVSTATANLFDKTSAYKLVIDGTGVTVIGKDTDAAFYGLTTVKRILQQVTAREVRHLTVEDYADVAFRGFIEGYYGQPWTTEDRVKLMEFGGEFKMNIYFYAPKNDPKHNDKWRDKYTDEELAELIAPLAVAGEKSKCRFGYALHCFMSNPFRFDTEANYQADLAVLKEKYEQGIAAGARQIALLADDANAPSGTLGSGNSGGDGYVKLLKDLTDWLASDEMQTKYPGLQTTIPFCPEAYGNGTGNHAQLKRLNDAPAGVSIIMTGGQVYGTVNSTFLSAFKNNVGRGAYLWINWPCSDNVRARIMMLGQDKFLKTGVDPDTIEGIMLNPMQQSEPSKVGLFCNADYAWNLWTDEAHGFKVWDDSFDYVENMSPDSTPEADAFRLLSQHMGYNIDSRPPKTDESQDMWPLMTAFRTAMASSTLTDAQIDELKAEYEKLYDAAHLYKNKEGGNQRILGKRDGDGYPKSQEQLLPWLDCAEEFTLANVELLEALKLIYKNSDGSKDSEIVEKYLSAQSHLTASQNHDFWSRSGAGDFTVKPEFGGQRLVPFANDLLGVVAETAQTILDPSILTETIITNRADTPEGGLAAMRDGNTATVAVFKSPNSIAVGEYVGVRYNRPIDLTSVRFEMGADNTNDTFNDSKLQYMDENGDWQDIPGATFTHTDLVLEATGLSLTAKGVRAIATSARTNTWFGVKEITINGKSSVVEAAPETATGQLTGSVIKSSRWEVYQSANPESALTDNDDSTTVWYKETGDNKDASIVGDYLGLDLGRVVKNVGRVRFVVGKGGGNSDKWTNFKLQYSTDNTNWTDAGTFSSSNDQDVIETDLGGVAARYVRFVNTVQVNKWLYFAELSVWADGASAILYQSDVVKKITNPVGTLANDSAALSADNVSLRAGEFVGIALPRIRQIAELIADYTPAPGLVLKVGMSEADLKVIKTYPVSGAAQLFAVDDAVTDFKGYARYIRLENVSDQTVSFRLNELSVKSEEIEEIHFEEEMSDMGFDASYGSQDTRENAAFFDGDLTTSTTLANVQTAGEYVTYDLGQLRPIRKLTMAMQEDEKNYLRHGVLEVSPDGEDWTTILTVDNDGAYNTAVKDGAAGSPGFTLGVPQQNWVSFVGELDENTPAVEARYLRIRVTQGGARNFISAAEIFINAENPGEMEYLPVANDPTFEADPIEDGADHTPAKIVDGDLTTGFRPNMTGKTSGYLIYRFSDETSIGQINIIQDTANPSNASVEIRTADGWQTLSGVTLNKGLNQIKIPDDVDNVLEIKLSWGNVTPTFYELITVPRAAVVKGGGQAASDPETIPINSYSGADRVINFDENWKFNLGDASGASGAVYNDAAWRTVNLPHDYSIEGEFTSAGEAESGYLIGGTGWYRKSFTIDPSWATKEVAINFGGVYMDCEVYLNGIKLGEHHYGYTPFAFVLPNDLLKYTGENVIAVKTDDAFPSSRWYSGAGIYRSVHLTVTEPVHVAKYGTKVETTNAGAVTVNTTVENGGANAAAVTLKQQIFELDASFQKTGAAVATETTSAATTVAANGSQVVKQTLNVSSPNLWNSWDKGTPNLYVLVTTVLVDGVEKDVYETEFGFREIKFTTDEGFKLNGKNLKLKGVCQHHDQGALGSEAWYRALERQVDILMDMGCNAIRVTHNPAADELIQICNRKGMLIIDEFFDGWHNAKNGNSMDFARWFSQTIASDNALVGKQANDTWAKFVLQSTVKRDMNAPCVIMYSIGNEITEGAYFDANYATNAENIIKWAQAIDNTRPLTYGQNMDNADNLKPAVADKLHAAGGVIGINYYASYDFAQSHNAGWLVYASETVSHVNSRGVYNVKGSRAYNSDKLLTSYDKSAVTWGTVASDGWWRTIRYDYDMGEFIWTGFDYIGEPTPSNGQSAGWVSGDTSPKNSYFGAIDTNGLPKDNYWLYRSMWNDNSHTLHILPTWDANDIIIDSSGKVEVVVYSDAPMVKLYLNNQEVGSATSTTHTTDAGHIYRTFDAGTGAFVKNTGHQSLYATFNVTYAEGTLRAVACDASGNDLHWITQGRSQVKTTSGASKLVAQADRATIKNDGRDLSYVTISVVDKNGEIVNGAKNPITVSVSGNGVFMGMDNGVQPDHTSYLSNTRKAGAGQLVAIVQSTKDAGTFTLTATAPGLTPTSVTVKTSGVVNETTDKTPVSYDLSKTIYVQLNTEPTLPATADVNLADGTSVTKPITWSKNAYDKALLGTAGSEFSITGTIDDYDVPVSIGVVVLDDIAALLNYSAAVRVGSEPTLPATRPAVMADGTVVSAQFNVEWSKPDPKVYNKAGTVIVEGTAKAFGKTYNVTATIRVSKGEYVEGGNVSSAVTRPTVNGVTDETLRRAFDGSTNTAWTGSGAAKVEFDTVQGLYRIVLTYATTVPTGTNAPTITLENGTVTVKPKVSGTTATYELGDVNSSVDVTLNFPSQVSLANVQLITATSVFPIGATAEFDGLKINGQDVTAAQLAAKVIKTPVENAVITPVSDYNVAVTILPENAQSKIIIVTESEDHNAREVYVVQLDTPEDLNAADATNDYDRTKTTATAPSQHGGDATASEGPAPLAVDGNTGSFWHSRWSDNDNANGNAGNSQGHGNLKNYPDERYIQLTLQEATPLTALRYYPRTDNSLNGTVIEYRVDVSTNGTTWNTVSSGTWAQTHDWKIAMFDSTVTAQYVRLYGVHTYADTGNDSFMSCSELRVVKAIEDDRVDLSAATIAILKNGEPFPGPFHWKNLELRPGDPTHSNVDDDITVTVTLYGKVLEPGTDYVLDYDNNVEPGTAYIYAHALDGSAEYQGAAATTFKIEKVQAKITSFQPFTVRVYPGVAPTLENEVLAFADDGHRISVPVIWDDIPEEWYNYPKVKERTLSGTVEDPDMLGEGVAQPTITLKFAFSQSADTVSLVTPAGITPVFPSTVTVRFDDGTSAQRAVTWLLDGVSFSTPGTVEVAGDIEGVDRAAAKATVRVARNEDLVQNTNNIALNSSDASYTGSGDNLKLNAMADIFPFALSYWSSGNNNPYQAIKGQTSYSNAVANRWSDWEQGNVTHTSTWMGVAFETSTQNVTAQQNQVLTLVPHLVNKAKVMFVDEGTQTSTTGGAVTFPATYILQYYTGPVEDLTFDTRTTNNDTAPGNGRVRAWTGSPLNVDANWSPVTVTGSYPAAPTTNGQMLEIEFAPVNTAILRVYCTAQSGNHWVGVQAFEVYDASVPANSDFTVTSITLGGDEKLSEFDANNVLEVELAQGAAIPKLAVTADSNAAVAITQASSVPGAAKAGAAWAEATITSEDGSKTETYTVKFTREGTPSGYVITPHVSGANADKLTITPMGGAAGTEIAVSVAKGYQLTDLWVTVQDGDEAGHLIKVTDNKFIMPSGNVTFSAGVSPITYQITYQHNEGVAPTPRNPLNYTVETPSFVLRNPTRPGYTFQGWVGSGLTTPTQTVTVSKGSIGDRTYIAVWVENAGIGGGGGNNSGGSSNSSAANNVTPAGNVVTTTTNSATGAVTVTTATPTGLVTAVTTATDGSQTAVIQVPENSGSSVDAVMPALDVTGDKTPEVKLQNNTGRPLSVTVPFSGSDTVVAVRQELDGSETVIPMSVVDQDGLRLKTQPGDQTILLVDNKKSFVDVPDSHWAAKSVNFTASRELFNGVGDDLFAPTLPMNRAMMTTVLWRLAEKPTAAVETIFDDVQPDSYYEEAVAWGVATGVVTGTDIGFEPDTPVTREMIAVLLYRAAGSPAVVDEMPRRFSDGAQVAGWAHAAVVWCIQNDILRGRDNGALDPKTAATRAEVATMLQRFVNGQV